jgi:protein O-GlcNAc transferase
MHDLSEAIAAHRRGDYSAAERRYRDLLRTTPDDAHLHYCMGLLCYQTGHLAESREWLQKSLALAPAAAQTSTLLIRICDETADTLGALRVLEHHLAWHPEDAAMLNVKGQQLARLGRLREAELAFREAAQRTGHAAMFHDLGVCHQLLGNPSAAAQAYHEAIRRGHDHPKTRLWLAQCLRASGQAKAYHEVITAASRSAPDDIELLIEAQSARRYVCDWDAFETHHKQLVAGLERVLASGGTEEIPPGMLNYLGLDEAIISAIARRYAAQLAVAGAALRRRLTMPGPRQPDGKIRLGYLSSDFFAHAVGFLVCDLFACHDRTRFRVYGYSLRHQQDAVQERIRRGFDCYRDLCGRSAEDIARSILEDRIDILIDLAGYTSAAQPVVLAARVAPIQISWLGYLGTSGGDFLDYLIADDITLPAELARTYTERIIRLPCFLAASPLPAPAGCPTRESLGLKDGEFVFCSFNQPYKLDRATFAAWMEILQHVPQSRLWIYVPDLAASAQRLRREAERHGVNPDRLVFAGHEPMARHLARMALADLALDPFHISGGATSVVALAAGVPVLTLRGNSFLARLGSSLNRHVGLDELDCQNPQHYIAKAVELARQAFALTTTKERLQRALRSTGFFDIRRFLPALEEALLLAWERYKMGLPPEDIRTAAAPRLGNVIT